jgi:hypothetical protein
VATRGLVGACLHSFCHICPRFSADPGNFERGAVASPAFDWWVVSMQVLGAPFAGGARKLSDWLDGPPPLPLPEEDAEATALAGRGLQALTPPEAAVARLGSRRLLVENLTAKLGACAANEGLVRAAVEEALLCASASASTSIVGPPLG